MPKLRNTVLESYTAVEPAEELKSKLESAFYGESPSFQDDVKAEAKRVQIDKLEYYASLLFQEITVSRYEIAVKKQNAVIEKHAKVMRASIDFMIATGKAEDEAHALRLMGFSG